MEIQWSLVLFTALTGTAGWMLASLCYAEVKGICKKASFPAALVALIVLIVGGLASVTHLAHPERMLNALGHPSSGIFVEAVLVGITALFVIVYLIVLKRGGSDGVRRGAIIAAAVCGVLLSFMAGESYMMPARINWNTLLLPCGYMGTVIPAGISLFLLVAKAAKESDFEKLPLILGIGGIVAAVLAGVYVAVTGGADAVLYGWVLAVCVGGVVPAVLGFVANKMPDRMLPLVTTTFVCALVGSIAFRMYMWVAVSTIDNFFSSL